jgi:hypothetical protein
LGFRDCALGAMKAGKEDAVRFSDPVGDNSALLPLYGKRSADQLLWDLQ